MERQFTTSMIYLTSIQIAFIIVVPIVAILGLFLFFRFPFAHFYQRLNFNNYVYHRIYRIVLNNDYYLINNYVFSIDEVHKVRIDHIIFAEKYIYICMDRYTEGNLMGNDTNASLILLSRNGDKNYVDNPYLSLGKILRQLSSATGLPTEMMVGLTIVNDDCQVKIETKSNQLFLLNRKQLNKLIKTIESRDVPNINGKELDEAVKALYERNENKAK